MKLPTWNSHTNRKRKASSAESLGSFLSCTWHISRQSTFALCCANNIKKKLAEIVIWLRRDYVTVVSFQLLSYFFFSWLILCHSWTTSCLVSFIAPPPPHTHGVTDCFFWSPVFTVYPQSSFYPVEPTGHKVQWVVVLLLLETSFMECPTSELPSSRWIPSRFSTKRSFPARHSKKKTTITWALLTCFYLSLSLPS